MKNEVHEVHEIKTEKTEETKIESKAYKGTYKSNQEFLIILSNLNK
jgi:hypothetical protein